MVAALVLAGCTREEEAPRAEPVTAQVERRDLVDMCTEDGVLEAYRIYSFYPDVGNNPLRALHVAEGDRVEAGALLFEFDTAQLDTERDILRARLEAAEAKLALLQERRTGLETVQARQQLVRKQQARADAEQELATQQDLAAAGLAPTSAVAQVEAAMRAETLAAEQAALQLRELEQHPRSPELIDIEVQIKQHRDALRRLEKRREQYAGTAPFSGRIVRINDSIKNLSALADDIDLTFRRGYGPLMILADIDRMRVLPRFFERDIARIRTGQRAEVSSKHVPGRAFEGEVVHVGELGDTVGRTTTVEVEVLVSNPKHLLKPGLKAETRVIVAEAKDVLSIPVEFVRHGDGNTFVWRLSTQGRRRKVAIQTGISDGRFTEIRSGLDENDVLVME